MCVRTRERVPSTTTSSTGGRSFGSPTGSWRASTPSSLPCSSNSHGSPTNRRRPLSVRGAVGAWDHESAMRGTGSVTESVPEPADEVFAFLTDVDRLPEWNAIIAEVAECPDVVQRDAEWVVEIKAMG